MKRWLSFRCVKANEEKEPGRLACPMVLAQLKNAGLFEAIRIRKSGYDGRIPCDEFAKRYGMIPTGTDLAWEPVEVCKYVKAETKA